MNLRIAAFSALAVFLSPAVSLDACERCKAAAHQRCACQQDDAGLLNRLDAFAGKFHKSVQGAAGSLVSFSSRGNSCDHKSQCHCTQKAPKNHHEPTCGCEQSPNCGCAAGNSGTQTYWPAQDNSWTPAPIPTPVPSVPSYAPSRPIVPAPLPDTQVNPFQDEDASYSRRVPAQAIQYRRPSRQLNQPMAPSRPSVDHYGNRYDVQANAAQFRMSDQLASQAPLPAPKPSFVMPPALKVILASAEQPARLSSETAPKRLPTQAEEPRAPTAQAVPAPQAPYHNPLR